MLLDRLIRTEQNALRVAEIVGVLAKYGLAGWFGAIPHTAWLRRHLTPARFHQIEEKMDLPVLYAIGSFIQALGQNPGIEQELRSLGYVH